jgi:predicted phage terminase large subunit-like protein
VRAAITGAYKFIVVINDTTEQVEITMDNIRHELSNNENIKADFPDLKTMKSWSKYNIVLSNGTRLIGRSRGQNIRGIRHRETRPDCIILDDPENLKQVKQKKNRDATEAWFNAEVLPAKSAFGAKLIVIGNMLHNDGFIARLSKNPLFTVVKLPAVNEETKVPLWLAQYPTPKSVKRKKTEVGATAWSREYMLKAVVSEDQPIKETDIQKYPAELLTKMTDEGEKYIKIMDAGEGMDLAISEKESADCTAIVGGYKVKIVIGESKSDKPHILILPHPVNKRMDFDTTQKKAIEINKVLPWGAKWYIEDVGYQKAALQNLKKAGLSVFAMRPISDKRARLESIAPFVKDGTVLFCEKGCEELIEQIINFGSEEHDDLVDAFVYLILGLINKPVVKGGVGRPDAI